MSRLSHLLLLVFLLIHWVGVSQKDNGMKKIKGGTFVPLYGAASAKATIQDFYLDVYPVTNGQFLDFVNRNEKWQKSRVIKLFADPNYLSMWENDFTPGKNLMVQSPVTTVSWYAAKAYCSSQNKRLPTMDEWEYAAMASETQMNAQEDILFNQRIIEGYEMPKTYDKEIGSTFENYWGIYDLHGLVWEWTSDFNSVLISGESRQDVDTERSLFCAGGSVGATDLMD